MSNTHFVSGASGQLGRAVVELLLASGAKVIAGSRSPEKLMDLKAAGAELRRMDFTDLESVKSALSGVDRALFVSTDAVGQRQGPQIQALQAAAQVGVKHLVYTSLVSADSSEMAISEEHRATEIAIQEAFSSYTLLRNNLYAELLFGAVSQAVSSGQLVTARGKGKVAWVSRQDCARAAAAALEDGFEGRRTLDIAGPHSLTGEETAAILQSVSGQPVQHLAVPAEALKAGMLSAGLPPMMAEILSAFDVSASKGLLDKSAGDLEALTGKGGRTLQELLEANRSAWAL